MTTLNARNLTLNDVHRLLGFQKLYNGSFTPLLSLEPITDYEQQELVKIQNDFDNYLSEKQALEGQVRLVAIAPLLRLTGYSQYPVQLKVEESIARITIEDEDTTITGRFDIIAINKEQALADSVYFWILVMETKPSLADPLAGLPQLLTYAYQSLEHQQSVWGLVTNGVRYQFVYIQSGTPTTYQFMPLLSLFETEPSQQLVQVLKAICK